MNEQLLNFENVLEVTSTVEGQRLDVFLAEAFAVSRSRATNLISAGLVTVNGVSKKKNYLVAKNDFIVTVMPELDEFDVPATDIPLNIVYEDEDVIVVNKPQGMVVHPAPGHYDDTLVNALKFHAESLSSVNGVSRPGIVHRIDMDTSGLLLVAKNDFAHNSLSEQIKNHSVDRYYEAIVHGTPSIEEGSVNYSIGRSKKDRKLMAAYPPDCSEPGVRNAYTHYKVLNSFPGFSHLQFKLETGRTHQIRVHMKAIGHPIIGDPLYCPPSLPNFSLKGQCLHAKSIGFIHPRTSEHLYFESELPDYFSNILKILANR